MSQGADHLGITNVDNVVGSIIFNVIVQGTISELTGGKFRNGALSAAFRTAFNDNAKKSSSTEDQKPITEEQKELVEALMVEFRDVSQKISDETGNKTYEEELVWLIKRSLSNGIEFDNELQALAAYKADGTLVIAVVFLRDQRILIHLS